MNLKSPAVLKNAPLYKTWEDAAVRRIVAIQRANSFRRWREVVRWGVCHVFMRAYQHEVDMVQKCGRGRRRSDRGELGG
eukprot:scaffold5575_cov102-Skeletonema_dohrnii-CCMP3373.AAC.5